MDAKSTLKALLPAPVVNVVRAFCSGDMRFRTRSSRTIFSEIYKTNAWGGRAGEFYSGPHFGGDDYPAAIRTFIRSRGISTVLDLACGDFWVGRQIAPAAQMYIGADVVHSLIERNSREFSSDRIRFVCLDMIKDPLPDAGLCLILQTLQHLSNSEIATVLKKACKFPYLIVSEHLPSEPLTFNLDQPHGPGIRLDRGSGVYLDRPPFNVHKLELLFETKPTRPGRDDGADWGVIRTFRVTL